MDPSEAVSWQKVNGEQSRKKIIINSQKILATMRVPSKFEQAHICSND
jgi:deoxyhypusine synthase